MKFQQIEKNKQSNTLSEDVLSQVLSSVSNPQDKAENKENMQDDLPVASNADATLNLTEIIENDTDAEEASINIKKIKYTIYGVTTKYY